MSTTVTVGSLFAGIGGLGNISKRLELLAITGIIWSMPRGSKPKTYPADLVADVANKYLNEGLTQAEIAASLGTTQKVIWRLMSRHGIQRRARVKRDQCGAKNSSWKGSAAGYAALHLRVQTARGTPSLCEHCGTTGPATFDWANLTGAYDDVTDYVRLCRSCHWKMDGTVKNLSSRKEDANARE